MNQTHAADEARYRDSSRPVRLLNLVGAVFLACTVTLAFVQVVLRFAFNNPQAWAEEVGRYIFVWLAFVGAAIAVAHDSHIRVDVLETRLGPRHRRAFTLLRRSIDLICFSFLLVSGVIVSWKNLHSLFYTIEGAPRVIFYLSVPVGCLFMLYFIIRQLLNRQ